MARDYSGTRFMAMQVNVLIALTGEWTTVSY